MTVHAVGWRAIVTARAPVRPVAVNGVVLINRPMPSVPRSYRYRKTLATGAEPAMFRRTCGVPLTTVSAPIAGPVQTAARPAARDDTASCGGE